MILQKKRTLDSGRREVSDDSQPIQKNFDSNKKFKGYSNYFNWMYGGKQWWATGFVPNIHDLNSIKQNELIQISSVDFTGNSEMFDALKDSDKAKQYAEYLIFDEEIKRLWIMW